MSFKNRISPEVRRRSLKDILSKRNFVRVIEVHNGLSAIIANNIKEQREDEVLQFDALWESSLTDSAAKGYPDAEIIGPESRYETIRQILQSSSKPLIVDGDTGGEATNFEFFVKNLEDLGVSMVIIEDKVFPKRNSLEPGANQTQEDPDIFATKIKRGKSVLFSKDFLIAARIESLISGAGLEDAILRARKYLLADADAIMIHSKDSNPEDILNFAVEYDKLSSELGFRKPLICVPTTYNTIKEEDLRKSGFNIVIYANHLLRSSHKAMVETASLILRNQRGFEAEPMCSPVKTIFQDVGFLEVKEKDKIYAKSKHHVIIPAAGVESIFDHPKSILEIKGKTIIQRQLEILNSCGIYDIVVIRGFKKDLLNIPGVKYIDNEHYEDYGLLYSLFRAEEEMEGGFIYINSDILFDSQIINSLLETRRDIVLVVDNSYTYHKHEIDKRLDLVMTSKKPTNQQRFLYSRDNEIIRIGKNIDKNMADYEYIGIAYFSEYGVKIIKQIYQECTINNKECFHATSIEKATFNDFIQEIIDRGFKVHTMEIHKGWLEIHKKKDVDLAEKLL